MGAGVVRPRLMARLSPRPDRHGARCDPPSPTGGPRAAIQSSSACSPHADRAAATTARHEARPDDPRPHAGWPLARYSRHARPGPLGGREQRSSDTCLMTAAMVLAAGLARRMGRQKLLLDLRGKPVVRWSVEAMLPHVADLVVVTGGDDDGVRGALQGLAVRFAVNPRPQAGQ